MSVNVPFLFVAMSVRALLDFGRTKRRARRPPQICTTLSTTNLGAGVRDMFELYRTPHIITASVSGQLGGLPWSMARDIIIADSETTDPSLVTEQPRD